MKTQITLIFVFVLLGFAGSIAQRPNLAATNEVRGSITGQVLDETGAPAQDTRVSLDSVGSVQPGDYFSETTDEKGHFEFKNLKPRRYRVFVSQIGYVLPEREIYPPEDRPTYRIGENITLNLQKGGVITGRVFDADGEPFIKVQVNAVRVRDQFGRKIPAERFSLNSQQNFTDDRGIYRIFGLNAGSYRIFVGVTRGYGVQSVRLAGSPPVYHPSDPLDTAAEIYVDLGQEISFVDVRFRELRGFTVSGKISGADPGAGYQGQAHVSLIHSATAQTVATLSVPPGNGEYSFKFEQIPPGEFEISALQWALLSLNSKSPVEKITVRNSDVAGIEINLKPLASIRGEVILEKNPDLRNLEGCRPSSADALTETVFRLVNEAMRTDNSLRGLETAADEKGKFELTGIEAGKFRLASGFADESLYFDVVYRQVRPKEISDLGRIGFSFSSGENLENVFIRLRDGAAKISGRIEFEKGVESRPANYAVYLIPEERESAEDVLRFRRVLAANDGGFAMTNIAPGKYFVLVKPFILNENEIRNTALPEFWKTETRLALLEEAKSGGMQITLGLCQNSADQTVKY